MLVIDLSSVLYFSTGGRTFGCIFTAMGDPGGMTFVEPQALQTSVRVECRQIV